MLKDSMFPLVFGVMSLENYEDLSCFLQNLKKVIGDKKVVIFYKHPAFLHSVSNVVNLENHVYCYHHLKQNLNNFFSRHNIRGNTCKENMLQFLDSITYARLEHDYNVFMFELRKYNDASAT